MVCRTAGRGTHRPPACSRRAGGKRAFERLPRDRPKELTQILRSAGEHVTRRWVLGEPKPADGPVFWWANNGRKSSCSPAARRRPRWFGREDISFLEPSPILTRQRRRIADAGHRLMLGKRDMALASV